MSDDAPSIAQRYHEATKYTPENVAQHRELDWDNKPKLWREFEGDTERVPLIGKLIGREEGPVSIDDLERALVAPGPRAPRLDLESLARILFLTNGVTRVMVQPAPGGSVEPFFFRAAPSAGGLYPTEIYVIARPGLDWIAPGAWNLGVRDLSLIRVTAGAGAWDAVARATSAPELFSRAQVAIVLTGVLERSGWRYEERAYRRVCLDTGHVLGNLVAAAGRLGWTALPIGGFHDGAIEERCALERGEEGPLLVVPLLPSDATLPPRGALALRGKVVREVPDELESLGLMRALHLATRLEPPLERAYGRDAPGDAFLETAPGALLPLPDGSVDWPAGALERTILHRRSTRAFDGRSFSIAQLSSLLTWAHGSRRDPAIAAEDSPSFIDQSLLETFVVLARSSDFPPGVYRYDPRERALALVASGARSREAQAICLGQELGRDAAAVVVHTVDIPRAIARYGDRAYRYVHLDAGHLGHRLNLGALRLGLGASGIGGFFDDHANALLGLPLREAIVYITTLGGPAAEEQT